MRSQHCVRPGLSMRYMKYALGLLLLAPVLLFAQVKPVSGTVKDDAGKPLPGVSVIVKGKATGTQTDEAGKFSLSAADGDIIEVSSVGFDGRQIRVGTATNYAISLMPKTASSGDEVVVVGYSTVKRKDLTGSVGRAPIAEMLKAPTPNIADALAGRVAGVVVSSPDGQPGSMPNIIVRGFTSITGDNTPLYVIDGIPIEGANIPAFNPNDIESMEILKDASATAIYGARGSNGVVVITSKKGKSGAPTVNFGISYGSQRTTKSVPLMNAYDYVTYMRERDSLSNNYATLVYPAPIGNVTQSYYNSDLIYGIPSYYNSELGATVYQLDQLKFPAGNIGNLDKYKNVESLDLQDAMTRNAPYQTYDLSVSGGNDKTRYFMSGNYTDLDGIMINSGFKRYVGRLSLDQTINAKLKMGINGSYAYITTWGGSPTPGANPTGSYSSANAPFYSIYGYRPIVPLDSNGKQTSNPLEEWLDPVLRTTNNATTAPIVNPVINQNRKIQNGYTSNLNVNGYIEYKILPNLVFRSSGSIVTNSAINKNFFDSLTQAGSATTNGGVANPKGSYFSAQSRTWTNSNQLTFNKRFAQAHQLTVIGVAELQGNNANTFGYNVTNITNPSLGINSLDNGTPGATVANVTINNTLASFLTQANYDYKGKYYLTASIRADGSSKFSQGNKWGYFPSGAVKWKFSEEEFLKDNKILSDGSIGFTYGQTGNNRGLGSDFPYLTPIVVSGTNGSSGSYSFNGTTMAGFYPGSLANAGLKWETITQLNLATHLGFFDNRINVSAEVYRKTSKNLLLNATIPYSMGYTSVNANIGSMRNQGLELSLNTTNIRKRDFTWSTSFNISWNRNKVLSLTQGQEVYSNALPWDNSFVNNIAYISKVGQQIGQMYGLVFDGLYQESDFNYTTALNSSAFNAGKGSHWVLKDEVPTNGNSRQSIQPGDVKYKDLNGDGVASLASGDYTVIGRGLPIHTGGFGNDVRYKNFDLNLFFQWSYGNNIINANRFIFEGNMNNAPGINQFATVNDRWTPTNTDTDVPRIYGYGPAGAYSSRVVEDGSYLRLKTVNIGYTLPSSTLRRLKIKSFRVYLSAQNLVTWTNYTGQDPEISVYNSPLTSGFDWSGYSRGKTYVIGANLSF